mgnify:CR=1 FL=1
MPAARRLILTAYQSTSGTVISLSAVTGLWSASRGVFGLLTGLNGVYGIRDDRSWLHTRLLCVGYTFAFLLLLLVVWLLFRPVYLLVKLPVLRTVNTLGGGALGLVWGMLLVFLAVWLLQRFDLLLTAEMVDHSLLLQFFANNSPLSLLTSL